MGKFSSEGVCIKAKVSEDRGSPPYDSRVEFSVEIVGVEVFMLGLANVKVSLITN